MPEFLGSAESWEERVCASWAVVWTGRRRRGREGDGDGDGETEEEEEGGREEVVGSIGLKCGKVDDVFGQSAEIGYWLGEEFWGRGWMTEIVSGFVQWVWRSFPVESSASASASDPSAASSESESTGLVSDAQVGRAHEAGLEGAMTGEETARQDGKWRGKGIDRIEAGVFAWNACGSGKVLEKCGFQKVGLMRGKVWKVVEGVERRCDVEIWDLLRGEGGG